MTSEEKLRKLLIPLYPFRKIKNEDNNPYYFKCWGTDQLDGVTFYYWFWSKDKTKKNEKRVILKEFEALINISIKTGCISRKNFNQLCPRTDQSGPCGFAVMLSIITDVAGTTKTSAGLFEITNLNKLIQLS